MNRIERVSLGFNLLFKGLFIALPILHLIGWTIAPQDLHFTNHIFQFNVIPKAYHVLHPLSLLERSCGFVVGLLPLSIDLLFLYYLIRLFTNFQNTEVFSTNNVDYIRKAGLVLLFGQLVNPIYQVLIGVVVTLGNPPGHRMAAITLDQTNIGVVLLAMLIILISWLVAEGYKLRQEQQLTI